MRMGTKTLLIDKGFHELANAIIIQAAADYRQAHYRNMKRPYLSETVWQIRETERFFRSAWFDTLSSLNGEQLLHQLKKEMGLEAVR